jgi:hypothetical protein
MRAELEQIGAVTANMCAEPAQCAELRLYSDEKALQSDPTTAKLIHLAQIAAIGSCP